jgi:predicted XRE-type DNA-binding protein
MKELKKIVTRDSKELAEALGLSAADAIEMDVRRQLNDKVIEAVKKSGMTHVQVAASAGMSRTRLTAILNRNRAQVSTDLMLRILATLGYRAKIAFSRKRHAA